MKTLKEILDTPVRKAGFSARLEEVFKAMNLFDVTVGDILKLLDPVDFVEFHSLGKKSLTEFNKGIADIIWRAANEEEGE